MLVVIVVRQADEELVVALYAFTSGIPSDLDATLVRLTQRDGLPVSRETSHSNSAVTFGGSMAAMSA